MNYTLHLPENYAKPPLPGRDEWIAALRSGEYKQGGGQLSIKNKFCCLGVLCKIQGRLDVGNFESCVMAGLGINNPLFHTLSKEGSLPKNVFVEYKGSERGFLTSLNDGGLSFTEIADVIEQVWDHAPKNW